MNRHLTALAIVAAALMLPSAAFGQRGRYSNSAPMTPFGPAYDPTTYRQAGYNPFVYEQLMEQKMMMAEQQAMLKQQQMLQKMQQQNAKNKNPKTPGTDGTLGTGTQPPPRVFMPTRTARKKHRPKKDAPIVEAKDTKETPSKDATTTTSDKPGSGTTSSSPSDTSAASKTKVTTTKSATKATTTKPTATKPTTTTTPATSSTQPKS
ncbi:MAG TPA: hypothetical protein VGZ22_26310 [Isosphaeraceae bacterium]|nr:hypothetical protein [Isosphaeraceae bacterium]